MVNLASANGSHTETTASRMPNVHFVGNEHMTRAQLLDAMRFDDLEMDAMRICALYYDFGFLEVKVDTPVREGDSIRVHIDEGVRYRIGRITANDVDENGAPITTPDGATTRSHLHVHTGEWFSRRVLVDDLAAVRLLYKDIGYAGVDIPPETSLHRETATVDLTIAHIDLGPRVTIDHVEVIGAPADVIARVRRAFDIADGDVFSETKLEAGRKAARAMGIFERVDVSYGGYDPKAAATRATLTIELTMKR